MEIAWKDVREAHFDRPRQVLLDDETVLTVEAVSREGGQLILRPETPAATVTVLPRRFANLGRLFVPNGGEMEIDGPGAW